MTTESLFLACTICEGCMGFVLKSKDYGLEYEKEFPPCPAPTNLKTYRGLEALTCLYKAHMPGNLRYCKTTNKSCPRGLPMGRRILLKQIRINRRLQQHGATQASTVVNIGPPSLPGEYRLGASLA